MFPPGHHHNGFVVTHALGHMINRTSCVKCMSFYKGKVVTPGGNIVFAITYLYVYVNI